MQVIKKNTSFNILPEIFTGRILFKLKEFHQQKEDIWKYGLRTVAAQKTKQKTNKKKKSTTKTHKKINKILQLWSYPNKVWLAI